MGLIKQMRVNILATGIAINLKRKGFTLIEILIVMLILVITIGVIGLSVTSLQVRNNLQPFIDRLYQKLNLYGQDAMLRQTELGFSFFDNKIEILSYKTNDVDPVWQVQEIIRIPPAISIQFKSLEPDIFMKNVARTDNSFRNDFYNHNNAPELIFSSGGQLSPFSMNISHPDEAVAYIISGEFSGEVSMEIVNN
jgi:prepilin-type N-terminal cleavage/methylation domain-containing protein